MGTWDTGIFDDDVALDFLQDFEVGGASAINDAFATVQRDAAAGYIDRDNGSMALAAAEIVATSFGQADPKLDSDLLSAILSHKGEVRALSSMPQQALLTIDLVIGSPESSELLSLFGEANLEDEFLAGVTGLRERLEAISQ